ncbi:sugar transporter [Permianibacter sp. IMCC34836]|nr:sugar transporter [Permianibacter fluminis]
MVRYLLAGALALAASVTQAAQLPSGITQQQIDMFRQLPPAEQERLAKQYGVDITALRQSAGVSNTGQPLSQPENVLPRPYPWQAQMPVDAWGNGATYQAPQAPEGLQPFGYDLFAGTPTTFAPATDIPVPPDFTVGPGDIINVQLFGKQSASYALTVGRDGTIAFPELGPIAVAGLSFASLQQTLQKRVSQQMIGVDANITLGELHSIRVFVLGDAYRPGSYTVSALSTVTNALFVSGGVQTIGSLRNIEIKRSGKLIGRFDLYDLLLKGDTSGDLRLQQGDVIFIPPVANRVGIDGQIRRPALYEIKPGETVSELVAMAGGMTADAYAQSTVLERIDAKKLRSIKTIDLTQHNSAATRLQDGDKLTVASVAEQVEESVELVGAVTRPGKYQWYDGIRVSDLLRSRASDLQVDVDLDYAVVAREKNSRRDITVLQFSLDGVLNQIGSKDDLVLQRRDRVLVFSKQMNDVLGPGQSASAMGASLGGYTNNSNISNQPSNQLNNQPFGAQASQQGAVPNQTTAQNQQSAQPALQPQPNSATPYSGNTQQQYVSQRYGSQNQNAGLYWPASRGGLNQTNSADTATRDNRRQTLLAPVLMKLRDQSRSGQALDTVEISGSVRFPGIYPMTEGFTLAHLLTAAGGLTEAAYTLAAEVTRVNLTNPNEATVDHIPLDLRQILDAHAASPALVSRDQVFIKQIPEWQEQLTVELRGEFVFPGRYTIRRGETLAQLIKRAGGFTQYAAPEGAVFTRDDLRKQESQRIAELQAQLQSQVAAASLSASAGTAPTRPGVDAEQATRAAGLLAQLEKTQAVGRLVIDLPLIVTSAEHDIQLESGDLLVVPPRRQTVSVVGEVQYSTSHVFADDLNYEDYIERSGGLAARADENRIYIVRANGQVSLPNSGGGWFGKKGVAMQPGDTIVVPLDTEYMSPLPLWTSVTQIIYQSAIAIAAISSL